MRVLHVAEVLKGGIGTVLQELAPYQADTLGVENLAFVVPEDGVEELGIADLPNVRTFRRTRRGPASFAALTASLWRMYGRFRPHLVHAHSTLAGVAVRCTAPMSRCAPAVVYCPQGWAFVQKTSPLARRLFTLAERGLAGPTDAIVTVSEAERRAAEAAGLPPEKLVVVRNGVSPGSTGGPPPTGFDPGRINLLFVGRFDAQKGFDVILQAMDRLVDEPIRLFAIGTFHRERARHDIPPNVECRAWMRREELDPYYAAADAVVMPSRWEGLPFVALEAMRNGTPVIGSDLECLGEVVRHGRDGYLVEMDNVDAWEGRIRGLDRESLVGMGKEAFKRYDAHFTAERMDKELLDVYRSVLPAREGVPEGRGRMVSLSGRKELGGP